MPEPENFADWTRRESWCLWEAVALIGGMEPFPNFLERLLETPRRPNADALRWRDIVDAARESCESGAAPWFLGRCDVTRRQLLETPVHPEGFVRWASGKGFAVADELQPYLFPRLDFLDLREREAHDARRQLELLRSDPAGEFARLRAAETLGMTRLSHWLEPERIARLYGNSLVERHVVRAIFAGTLPARRVCTGFAIHVDDFINWAGMPTIPDGAAGDSVRAWLSLSTVEVAAVPEHEPVENAARVVALPVPLREVREMKRSALIPLMRKTYPQAASWFSKTGPGSIQEAEKLPKHGMWNAAAALSWAEAQTGKRPPRDDWPDEEAG